MNDLEKRIYRLENCKAKLTLKDGEILTGDILYIFDPEEDESEEEGLSIELSQGDIYYLGFSEIADAERAE